MRPAHCTYETYVKDQRMVCELHEHGPETRHVLWAAAPKKGDR